MEVWRVGESASYTPEVEERTEEEVEEVSSNCCDANP